MGRDNLGEFEQLVLLACIRLGDGAYTVAIMREIETRAGRATSHAAVYVALRRLEQRGMVNSRLGEATSERGGRPKRYFEVCPPALPALLSARDGLMNMWQGIDIELDRSGGGLIR